MVTGCHSCSEDVFRLQNKIHQNIPTWAGATAMITFWLIGPIELVAFFSTRQPKCLYLEILNTLEIH